jgi:NADH-quinone oxidoreductase subunit I
MLVKEKKSVLSEIYFWDIIKGLSITMRNMLFAPKVTIQYPEERRQYSDRFRGMHYIKATNGVENCTACMLCPTVCPAECIHIEAGERPDKEKYPIKFEIDMLRCCFCGMCEEACPKDAIKLSTIYDMSTSTRDVWDKSFLLEQRGNK